jgi:hypothetical protein
MVISDYSFGRIVINDTTYSKDVIIFPDRVLSPWWRGEGHLLQVDDLVEIVKSGIAELVIGTGYYGTMKVPSEVIEFLNNKGITTSIEKTSEAVEVYNRIASKRAAIAALHLTC